MDLVETAQRQPAKRPIASSVQRPRWLAPAAQWRRWLADRRVLIASAAVLVVGGLALNWGWFVAVGAAPLILSVAPCLAMCALGVCAMNRGGAGCSKDEPQKKGE